MITSPSGRIYVGSTLNITKRKSNYKRSEVVGQTIIYRSIQKYGWENHIFTIIEECNFDNRFIKERYWGEYYNVLDPEVGLNCILPATDLLPPVYSEETRRKMSEWQIGKVRTPEARAKGAASNRGKQMAEGTRRGLLKSLLGIPKSKECRDKISKTKGTPVINIETNEIYSSINLAAKDYGRSRFYVTQMLKEQIPNTSNLRYYFPESM